MPDHKTGIIQSPAESAPVNDKPSADIDTITDQTTAQPIEGHEVRIRFGLDEIGKANESGGSKY